MEHVDDIQRFTVACDDPWCRETIESVGIPKPLPDDWEEFHAVGVLLHLCPAHAHLKEQFAIAARVTALHARAQKAANTAAPE